MCLQLGMFDVEVSQHSEEIGMFYLMVLPALQTFRNHPTTGRFNKQIVLRMLSGLRIKGISSCWQLCHYDTHCPKLTQNSNKTRKTISAAHCL